jgi:SAM-dependent methyltransferase
MTSAHLRKRIFGPNSCRRYGKMLYMEEKTEKKTYGLSQPFDEWLELNRSCTARDVLEGKIAPFPPPELMQNVSGLTKPGDFASHGIEIFSALVRANPKPFIEYRNILDFGCGCGRLARMFKGFPHHYIGCDVDPRHVDWINQNLDFMRAFLTQPRAALPFQAGEFDCVISISVFTHITEEDHWTYLRELHRITKPGARLFITVHGLRAVQRAQSEQMIFDMLSISRNEINRAVSKLSADGHYFIKQSGHLTSENYLYGITFISDAYIQKNWGSLFSIEKMVHGGIHDFQDIVVLRR